MEENNNMVNNTTDTVDTQTTDLSNVIDTTSSGGAAIAGIAIGIGAAVGGTVAFVKKQKEKYAAAHPEVVKAREELKALKKAAKEKDKEAKRQKKEAKKAAKQPAQPETAK